MSAIPAYYGNFNFNDGINYFLISKDNYSFPTVKQTFFKMARLDGVKKTGESIDQRTITCEIFILGVSRVDLEKKIDALYQALWQRSQYLVMRANDNRQGVADCVDVKIKVNGTNIAYAKATVTFVMQNPFFALPTQSTYDTGSLTLTLVSGTLYQSSPISLTSGGNVYAWPTITITSRSTLTWSNVTLQQQTDSQNLQITTNLPATSGDYLTVYCDPAGANGFSVFKNGSTLCSVNGVFPVIEPGTTTFVLQVNASAAPVADLLFAWTPRFLS
jgi:hypothetical protein